MEVRILLGRAHARAHTHTHTVQPAPHHFLSGSAGPASLRPTTVIQLLALIPQHLGKAFNRYSR